MIADLDRSIRNMLVAEIPIENGSVEIKFEQPKREWSARLNGPTINLFLYDLRENVVLRQHLWEQQAQNGNSSNLVRLKRTPFRVDLYYMITAWSGPQENADDEHELISRCLMAFFRNPIIPEAYLVGQMKQQPFDIAGRIASHDKLTNPAEVWSALDNELRASVSYLVTIAVDPWAEIEVPLTRSLQLRTGPAGDPADGTLDGVASDATTLSGQVLDKKGQEQPSLQVSLKGTSYRSETREDGRYVFESVPPGEYTLVVRPPKGRAKERRVKVPGDDYDFTI